MYAKKELYIFECECLPQYFSEISNIQISNVYLFKSCVCRFRYKNASFNFTTPLIVRSVNRSVLVTIFIRTVVVLSTTIRNVILLSRAIKLHYKTTLDTFSI